MLYLADMYELDSLSVGMPWKMLTSITVIEAAISLRVGLENALKDVQRLWIRPFTTCNRTVRGNYLQNC